MPATSHRTLPRVLAVAAAAIALSAAAPATLAHAGPSGSVAPSPVTPGSRVNLHLTGCGTTVGTAYSEVFNAANHVLRLTASNAQATNLYGQATISSTARLGENLVTFICGGPGGESVSVRLIVISGPARGGLGGSVDSMSPGQIAAGGALVASALGSGAWFLRRRTGHAS